MKKSRPAQRPIEEVAAARAFYAGIGQDVRYFSALWHTFSVGHMLTNDLDRICRQFGLSIADLYLMGALRIDRPQPLRATDLAVTLQVSSAGTNVTDDPRWTYIVIVNPADACWNGGPADAFQTDGLTLHKELDDERFPIIG